MIFLHQANYKNADGDILYSCISGLRSQPPKANIYIYIYSVKCT